MKKMSFLLVLLLLVVIIIGCSSDEGNSIGNIYIKENDEQTVYAVIKDFTYNISGKEINGVIKLEDSDAQLNASIEKELNGEQYCTGNLIMNGVEYIANFVINPRISITGRAYNEDYSEVYILEINKIE